MERQHEKRDAERECIGAEPPSQDHCPNHAPQRHGPPVLRQHGRAVVSLDGGPGGAGAVLVAAAVLGDAEVQAGDVGFGCIRDTLRDGRLQQFRRLGVVAIAEVRFADRGDGGGVALRDDAGGFGGKCED